MKNELKLSQLRHTWILDLDGTLCVHNGYKNGGDVLLPGVREFFASIPEEDYILIITSRQECESENTLRFLKESGLRYNKIVFDAPMGERILVNDDKPSGLQMCHALRKIRDEPLNIVMTVDSTL